MTGVSKSAWWREQLDDFSRSGLSIERCCAERDIPAHCVYYRRRKLSSRGAVGGDHGGIDWLSVPISSAAPAWR